jgi:hypothetical protein
MMEFFLSKMWLFVCGIAVTAVLVMAFSGMDHAVSGTEAQHRVVQMAEVLDSLSDSSAVQMRIAVSDYLPEAGSTIRISQGYLGLVTGNERCYASLHSTIILTGIDGVVTGNVTLVHGDVLIVHREMSQKGCILVQVAKERTVSLTA